MGDGLPPLREVIAAHGLSASKSLGQNFLFDEQLLNRIAAIPGDLSGRRVLEVGPGPGGLTRALLRAGAQVTAIEMDRRCLPALAELGEAFPGRLTVIEGDALKMDHDALFDGAPYAVLSNLPYNVGTALFTRTAGDELKPGGIGDDRIGGRQADHAGNATGGSGAGCGGEGFLVRQAGLTNGNPHIDETGGEHEALTVDGNGIIRYPLGQGIRPDSLDNAVVGDQSRIVARCCIHAVGRINDTNVADNGGLGGHAEAPSGCQT